ncbi:MAG: hypothetical protein ACJAT7_000858 [Psychromonas sp.]|jgi:uncharacterized protein YqcC (DUF446 family)|uniref:YqcC family protein n=1 Tax=Psychromonas sp. TaxID=1884585 RepID=UPI0039E40855
MSENEFILSPGSRKNRHLLLQLLAELEQELRQLNLWQSSVPSEQALSSCAPFAIDTLTFVQWLQFIFIDKMCHLLQFSLPLPESMSVLPMASEYFKALPVNSTDIKGIISRIDLLINARVK